MKKQERTYPIFLAGKEMAKTIIKIVNKFGADFEKTANHPVVTMRVDRVTYMKIQEFARDNGLPIKEVLERISIDRCILKNIKNLSEHKKK